MVMIGSSSSFSARLRASGAKRCGPFGLEFVAQAQAGFKQGGGPFCHYGFHILIRRNGALFKFDFKFFGNLVEVVLFGSINQRNCHPAGPGAPRSGRLDGCKLRFLPVVHIG